MAVMKALSVRNPWAWLIVQGLKDIENRTWQTSYRGPVLIHAGVTKANRIDMQIVEEMAGVLGFRLPKDFRYGGIVGVCNITGCVRRSDSPWFEGPYGLVVANGRPLPFLPMKGQLSFFDVNLPDHYLPLLNVPPGKPGRQAIPPLASAVAPSPAVRVA